MTICYLMSNFLPFLSDAEELGIDPHRIAVIGESAGGHLAACVGVLEGFDDSTDNLKISALTPLAPGQKKTCFAVGLRFYKPEPSRPTRTRPCRIATGQSKETA